MAGYRWVRLDVDYFTNPKISRLSLGAKMLHLASITYVGKHTTDGHIPQSALRELSENAQIGARWRGRRAHELEVGGLWTPNGDGWYLHDWEIMNPQAMRHIVERDRAAWRERQARARNRRHPDVTP